MVTKTLEEVTEVIDQEASEKKENKTKKSKTPSVEEVTPLETTVSATDDEPEPEEGIYVHKFKTPFEDCGEVYTEIEFDFNALTGTDMIKVENEMKLKGIFGEMLEVSKAYQSHIAVRAAGKGKHRTAITVDALERMPVKDFFKITNQVRDFLIASGG